MHFPENGRHFEFGSYINYYKFETFLMPNETFVDIFIGLIALSKKFIYLHV